MRLLTKEKQKIEFMMTTVGQPYLVGSSSANPYTIVAAIPTRLGS